MAAKVHWDEVPPQTDAFDPENRLCIMTGPFCGMAGIAASRWQVSAKSPLHGTFSYCNLGGSWGAQLKFSGIGAVFGSKNLKAVCVRGSGKVEAADREQLSELKQTIRAILVRQGQNGREHDALAELCFTSPLKGDYGNPECLVPGKDGKPISRKGMIVDRNAFEKMKDEFYALRGWDVAAGLQTKTQLDALDLTDNVNLMVFKTMAKDAFRILSELLCGLFPGLSLENAVKLLNMQLAISIGLYTMTNLSAAQQKVLENPEFEHFKVN